MPSTNTSTPRASGVAAYAVALAVGGWILSGPQAATEGRYLPYGAAVVVLPALLKATFRSQFGPVHTLWVTAGLGLHPLGAIYDPYAGFWWWDHLTHFLAASLLAAGAYLVVRRIRRVDAVPARGWVHGYTFGVVLVASLGWEYYELLVPHLTVYGVEDTVKDLLFDLIGWLAIVLLSHELLDPLVLGIEVPRPRNVAR